MNRRKVKLNAYSFVVSRCPWNDENDFFYRKNRPRATKSKKEAKFVKILITSSAALASQYYDAEFLHHSDYWLMLRRPWLQILDFVNSTPNRLVFFSIAISHPYTFKTTKLA